MTKADSSSTTDKQRLHRSPTVQGSDSAPSTRIDAPHEVCVADSASDCAERSSPLAADATSEQLRLQADQLAAHLRGRQKGLDGRESELNSRIARWESDVRATRLWLEQRQAEISAEEESLARRRLESSACTETLDLRTEKLHSQENALAEKEDALARREDEINNRERELRERLERLAVAETAQLKIGEKKSERAAEAERRIATSERLIAKQQRAKKDIERKRRAVERRAEHVDKCQASLRQLRDELGRMHRETLEIRLATEELWVQLAGAAPPAALTRSLGRIRTKLAEQYAHANAELSERKKELETIRSRLEEQYNQLVEQRRRFERWATGRRQECESQASRLIAREKQLQNEEDQIHKQSQSWQAERIKFQHALHGLRKKNPRTSARGF